MKQIIILLTWLCCTISLCAQDSKHCHITISGILVEDDSRHPVAHAQIVVSNQSTILSNHTGEFTIKNYCKGPLHLVVKHLSYEIQDIHLEVVNDTSLVISLARKTNKLDTVGVQTLVNKSGSQSTYELSKIQRLESQGQNLAEVLEDVSGVNILRTGSTIAKPVINGLFGNRLIVLNNGTRHESQQWGTDHAPEIDPFAGQIISVIKNADAVRYGPDALGGVIKIDQVPIQNRILAGNIHTAWNSNGRAGTINTQLEGSINSFSYRIGMTAAKAGNYHTSDYYLGNTGRTELNGNLLLQWNKSKNNWALYISHFGTELGIFEGAHIGSKEDILARIAHGRPFESYDFSYVIQSPKQHVIHQLAKLSHQYQLNNDATIETYYSLQRNHRQEFDLRRVQADDIPMADIIMTTQQLETVFKNRLTSFGVSGSLQVNNNIAGTGTTPIIPNFDNHTFGAFITHKILLPKHQIDFGMRYDYKYFDAAGYRYDYSQSHDSGIVEQYLLQDQKHFNNISGVVGLTINLHANLLWKNNMGLAWRAPSANELYSDGIHHGTGTYELGNIDLKSEKGLKYVSSIQYSRSKIKANIDIFGQWIDNYIFSQPNPDSVRQTIRGTFPLFEYQQSEALFFGMDVSLLYDITPNWQYQTNISTVRAKNISEGTYLPYIPADKFQQAIAFHFQPNRMTSGYLKIKHHFQAKQTRFEENSDFAVPPPAYHLVDIIASMTWEHRSKNAITLLVAVDNVFNTAYKDYMDRFRYYTHGLGRNVSLKINYKF